MGVGNSGLGLDRHTIGGGVKPVHVIPTLW